MDTVRIARDMGTVSSLLPEGVSDMKDAPFTWFDAVKIALTILSFDELASDERPPRRMWLNGDQLKEWFDGVKRRREAKYGSASKPIEDPVDNAAAASLLVE